VEKSVFIRVPPGKHPLSFEWINGHAFAKGDVQRPASDPISVANPDSWETARSYEVANSLRVDFQYSGSLCTPNAAFSSNSLQKTDLTMITLYRIGKRRCNQS